MKALLALAFVLATFPAAGAASRHNYRYGSPYGTDVPPCTPRTCGGYDGKFVNPYGTARSGVAPSTAPQAGRSVVVVPSTQGAHTGGTKD